MKRSTYLLGGLLAIGLIFMAFTKQHYVTKSGEMDAVKEVILKSYVHGAFNELNPEAMLKGFHQEFAIYSADGENLKKYPIATWAEGVRKRKSDSKFDPVKNKWDHNFANIDITGGSAAVKIELSHEGKHVYTDYLSLLKFDSGWKIVAKVYHSHKKK